jgi:hypothetical protein
MNAWKASEPRKSLVVAILLAALSLGVLWAADRSQSTGIERPVLASAIGTAPLHVSLSHGSEGSWGEPSDAELTQVVQRTCVACHNDQLQTGTLSLQSFSVQDAFDWPESAEKMISKLRAEMMPPPGIPRPGGDTLLALVERLEQRIDEAAAGNFGHRTFQRLNRIEYERSIWGLLGLEVDASNWLPLDMRMANFDNIADAQVLSATLLEGYLNAAAEVSRMAVGDPLASSREVEYRVPRWVTQTDRVDGAPFGTRGGVSAVHNFIADGEYSFRVSFHHETTGALVGNVRSALHSLEAPEQLEISIDGERVALLDIDPWMNVEESPEGVELRTPPIFVEAGPKRVAAAFIQRIEGPVQDLVRPHDWSLASTAIAGVYGVLSLPHLRDLVVIGPTNSIGVSDHAVRDQIFICRPAAAADEQACAQQIITRLATRAYRRALDDSELDAILSFYNQGAEEGGFDVGIRTALEAILASPSFVFRVEREPSGLEPGAIFALSDGDLATRLSFFLLGQPPDDEFLALADEQLLSDPEVLEAQVRMMLSDPRVPEALATRFAAQWLRLHDLAGLQPNVRRHPEFHEQLREAMQRETEEFFGYLVREDRSLLELYSADYTFLNERMARHYEIPGVAGAHFRRVEYPDGRRIGILSHASILASTSHAARTSPTDRGKWVMEVLLGAPPPPPPPVPALDETAAVSEEGRALTTRERMAIHTANPTCNACHQFMDPIGIALEQFDVTGRYRTTDYGLPMDTRGQLYDGTPITSTGELLDALLARPIPLVRTFTENLLAYALGRRVEWYDKPTVRAIARQAQENDYRLSEFIVGVVLSDQFRMKRAAGVANEN